MSIFSINGGNASKCNKTANKTQGERAYCTNNIVQKCLSFAVSLTLMLGMAPSKMAQAASEVPEGRTLSGIDFNGVTVASSWADKYDQAFYSKIESEYSSSYNSADTALEIGTAAELAAFAKFVNDGVSSGYPDYKNSHGFENKFVCLTDDIDLQGVAPTVDYQNDGADGFKVVLTGAVSNSWVPIGYNNITFNGTFDGKNHSILGMVEKSESYGGLFGFVSGATIQNVGVKNGVVIAGNCAGKIVGYEHNSSTIQNCYATGTVYMRSSTYSGAGGIVGSLSRSTIKNCYNSGGIFAMSTFSSAAPSAGGICGNLSGGIVDNCFSTGGAYAYSSTRSDCSVGGIVGYPYGTTLSNSYYDQDAAPGNGTTDEGLSAEEFEKKVAEMTDENGDKTWFLAPEVGAVPLKKTPRSSDFTFTLPDDLYYDGQGKVITIKPKDVITGIGAVTVKYYKVNSDGTLGTASTTPPTDAGRYKVKFDVASGTEYYSATDLPAIF